MNFWTCWSKRSTMMIDRSEKRKPQLAFELQNSCVYEKHSRKQLISVTWYFCFLTIIWLFHLHMAMKSSTIFLSFALPKQCQLPGNTALSAPPPTSSNIENWWERDDRWHHNAPHITSSVKKKKNARKRCGWNCDIWPNWFTSHQSYYCLY